jgi:hypothetical protein
MTEKDRDEMTEERLGYYRKRMRQQNATPLVCLGIGHGEHKGELVLCATEDLSIEMLRAVLHAAALTLK